MGSLGPVESAEKPASPNQSKPPLLLLQVLQRVLSPEEFARWESLTLQKTLDRMADAAYCPRCSTVSLEDADSCAQCPK